MQGLILPPAEIPLPRPQQFGYTPSHSNYKAALEYYKNRAYADPSTNYVSLAAVLILKQLGKKSPTTIGVWFSLYFQPPA